MSVPDDRAAALIEGLRLGERRALARAITYAESTVPEHAELTSRVLDAVLPRGGQSLRVAISGPPGAGKSTLIEALGQHAISLGLKPAVLAIDPSSPISGGAILGDKTRMEKLAARPEAFVRPSPSSGRVGGIGTHTREAIVLCEAAGFDIVIVETVGTGQSEISASQITDVFVLLQIPGAGDDLQAIKKGALELADILVVNKCDLDAKAAQRAAHDLSRGRAAGSGRRNGDSADQGGSTPERPIVLTSALTGAGIEDLWSHITGLHQLRLTNGTLAARRRAQSHQAIWSRLEDELLQELRASRNVLDSITPISTDVAEGRLSTLRAVQQLLRIFRNPP